MEKYRKSRRKHFLKETETQEQWEEKMSQKLLQYIRNKLYVEFRFLDVALSALTWQRDNSIQTFAVNGTHLCYSTEQLIRLFENNTKFLERAYLHSVFHCMFSHLWIRKNRNPAIWNIACDIAVEYNIDHLDCDSLRRPISLLREQTYTKIINQYEVLSAASAYRYLWELPDEKLQALQKEFYTDNHKYWPKEEKLTQTQTRLQSQWNKIAKQSAMNMEQQGNVQGELSSNLEKEWQIKRGKYSYKEFLKKFALLKEELHCNPDEFDLGYYVYGLSYFKNLPLIEPCESKEMLSIREFVIVVDTSYSTNGVLVENFLRETYNILTEQCYFGRQCNIHILQCDNQVQSDYEIHSAKELEQHLSSFTILGGGGTDFRPAFQYMNTLLEQKKLDNLQGVLYFTDGKGTYPQKKPKYKTAFLFLDDYQEQNVPAWAMSMRILPEELE